MTAYHFALTTIATGRVLGHALLCPDSRYASLRWRDAERLLRGFALATTWPTVVEDLRIGWPKGFVDPLSATARLLVPTEILGRVSLQLMTQPQIAADDAAAAREQLDAYLWSQVMA